MEFLAGCRCNTTSFIPETKRKTKSKNETDLSLPLCSSLSRIHRSMHFFEESNFFCSFVGRFFDRRCVCAHFYQLEFYEGNGLMGSGSFEEKFSISFNLLSLEKLNVSIFLIFFSFFLLSAFFHGWWKVVNDVKRLYCVFQRHPYNDTVQMEESKTNIRPKRQRKNEQMNEKSRSLCRQTKCYRKT